MVETIDHLTSNLSDNTELYEMSKADDDTDGLLAIEAEAAKLEATVAQLEFRRMFDNPADPSNCFVDLQAGAGGTEACDWAQMLLRQYLRYCERKGFKTEVMEESEGDVAGIKSATIKVEGEYAFGLLRTETGVHRLVRKSPFDSAGGRHTSFASVFVYPEVDDSIEIDINPADVRTDTFRASGAGGQHINKTDSAVRLTHMPDRHRRAVPERPLAAQEPRRGVADAALAALRARDEEAHGRAAEARGQQDRRRLGPPDQELRARPEPHQGPAHQRRDLEHAEGARRRPGPVHRGEPEAARLRCARAGAAVPAGASRRAASGAGARSSRPAAGTRRPAHTAPRRGPIVRAFFQSDTAMREGSIPAPIVRREDYAPPAYRIRSVDLCFDLDPARTLVTSRMRIERDAARPRQPLCLNGVGLTLLRVLVDGASVAFRNDGATLVIDALPEGDFTLEIRNTCAPATTPSCRASTPRPAGCSRSARPRASGASPTSSTGPT